MKINKEYMEKLILSEMKNKKNKNNYEQEIELWKIETFFLTFFCAVYGWLYCYSSQETEKNNKNTVAMIIAEKRIIPPI